jgi:hypothetical protein
MKPHLIAAARSTPAKSYDEGVEQEFNSLEQRRLLGFDAEAATATGSFNLKFAMAVIAASCLGAAVFAAPMTITPKAKILSSAHRTSETKLGYAPLGKGPAFQLGRAAAGEDEDCVRVTRMVGPDGRVYVTRGLICQ